jgi:alkanesulfonate monooxygenase SsuD/methylene tetrahydromethanopterin reductase-like flavin-dependent oxidoreductase (luciferase family)
VGRGQRPPRRRAAGRRSRPALTWRPLAARRAARVGDAWFANPHASLSELREGKAAYDAVREERGESAEIPVFRETFVALTTEAAVETACPDLESKYDRYFDWGQDEAMDDPSSLHGSFEEFARDRFLLGTPTEVAAAAERYREELDASHLVCRVHWPGMPTERALDCLDLLGDEVAPAL